jgi:hypothetical protein
MNDTMTRYVLNLDSPDDRTTLYPLFQTIADMASCQSMERAAIAASVGATTCKIGAVDWYGIAQGKLQKIAAATVLPALVGTISQNKFNVYCFYVDAAGTVTSQMGTEGTTKDLIVWPIRPIGKTLIGAAMFNPTTAPFIGGTTNADAANTFIVGLNVLGSIDASFLV